MDALLVVDMQHGLLEGAPKYDLNAVVSRIGEIASHVRRRGGIVIFIQHHGPAGDLFEPNAPGWELLHEVRRRPEDLVVSKSLNDPFHETGLDTTLAGFPISRILVSGWATDLCVDATVRSAASRGYRVVAVADAHTVSDRPHLSAEQVIVHHHWVWTNLIATHTVRVVRGTELFE